jgi:hypothetical protein
MRGEKDVVSNNGGRVAIEKATRIAIIVTQPSGGEFILAEIAEKKSPARRRALLDPHTIGNFERG